MTNTPPPAQLTHHDGVALLRIDSPPVNALSHAVRRGIHEGLATALAQPDTRAIVLTCGGRTFFAGADINELGKPMAPPLLKDLIDQMELAPIPVIAAMHGNALGGGLELALACHYRAAAASTRLGLPEVNLGLLPGAGGTQRLPRVVGPATALTMMLLAQTLDTQAALAVDLIDEILPDDGHDTAAIAFAHQLIARQAAPRRTRDRNCSLTANEVAALQARARQDHAALFDGPRAPTAILEAVVAATTLSFNDGLAREAALSRELVASPESAAQRHLFFAERSAGKAGRNVLTDDAYGQALASDLLLAWDQHLSQAKTLGELDTPALTAALWAFGFRSASPLFEHVASAGEPHPAARSAPGETPQLLGCLSHLADRAARLLATGTADREADVDLVAVTRLGWPRHRGGPLFWARQQGTVQPA